MPVRLACVRPAASVHSEPGSNSQVESTEVLSLTSNLRTSALMLACKHKSLNNSCAQDCRNNQEPTNREAFTQIIGPQLAPIPYQADMLRSDAETPKPPTYLFIIIQLQRASIGQKFSGCQLPDISPSFLSSGFPGYHNNSRCRSFPTPKHFRFGKAVFRPGHQNPQEEKHLS